LYKLELRLDKKKVAVFLVYGFVQSNVVATLDAAHPERGDIHPLVAGPP